MKKSETASRKTRANLVLTRLSLGSKLCSTCSFWGGKRDITPRGLIEIHPYSKGKCRGDGFRNMKMAALSSCANWRPWPLSAKTGGGQQRRKYI